MRTHRKSDAQYFLLPTVNRLEQKISFIFSKSQVVEIIQNVSCCSVPFSPGYIKGVAQYNQQLLPVACLEELVGLDTEQVKPGYSQFVVVRSSEVHPETGDNLLIIVAARSKLHFVKETPGSGLDSFQSCQVPQFITNTELIRGIFENESGYALIVNFDQLLLSGLLPAVQ